MAALQNLVKIMSLYYQYMESYMGPALFAVSAACCASVFRLQVFFAADHAGSNEVTSRRDSTAGN